MSSRSNDSEEYEEDSKIDMVPVVEEEVVSKMETLEAIEVHSTAVDDEKRSGCIDEGEIAMGQEDQKGGRSRARQSVTVRITSD